MNEHDPGVVSELVSLVISFILAAFLWVGRMTFNRFAQKADEESRRAVKRLDDLDNRTRELEKNSVTRSDLRRLEDKMDEHYKDIQSDLKEILERSK